MPELEWLINKIALAKISIADNALESLSISQESCEVIVAAYVDFKASYTNRTTELGQVPQ